MAHEFKKLGDVEIAEAISESANVLIEEEGNIKRVSKNNVVPNNVALKSDIPDAVINPSSAVVGQTIVVKAVDETGKPTEWECADMSSGVTSWNDLTDKPFYETAGNILFNGSVSFANNGNASNPYGDGVYLPIEDGKKYIVIIDGVEYIGEGYFESPDSWISFNSINVIIYDNNINWEGATGTHTFKIIDKDSVEVKQIDKKFIPGLLPVLIKVKFENGSYSSEFTYSDIENLVNTGTLLYAVITDSSGIMSIDNGYFYYSHYSMPDDDRLHFYNPLRDAYITFSSLGTIWVD